MHMKPELGDDDDEEKVMKDIETKDPFEPRLKALSNDKPVSGYPKAWNVRLFNDQSDYVVNGFVPSKTCNGIIDLQSLVWPGAHVIYSVSIYALFVARTAVCHLRGERFQGLHPAVLPEGASVSATGTLGHCRTA